MTAEEARARAQQIAEAEGWPFLDPVSISFRKRWFKRGGIWTIFTHSNTMGSNVEIVIDDVSGEVLNKKYLFIRR